MKNIILIGGGGHCRSVIDVIEQEGRFKIVGIIDKQEFLDDEVLGYPIIGNDSDLGKLSKVCNNAIVTVGQIRSPLSRINLFNLAVSEGFMLPSIVSPAAYVSKHASIGGGTVIMHNALINTNAKVGHNCIINSNAIIEHDCNIKDHCHISTNTVINGGTVVGKESFVGSGALTKERAIIDDNSFIKAGSIVK
jgi:sugar O-acyltransferase (sialic acid O-acetyltransferase NeuD family)